MTATTDCIFCAIVGGTAPASRVYEDEAVLAFMDIRPFSQGHTLIIPKEHASGLAELDPALGGLVFQAARRIALALRRCDLPVDGVNLMLADGAAAMQTVFHVHIHAVPRRHGDKLSIAGRALVRRSADLERSAEQVRTGLARLAAESAPD
jgi:diadenosine tetraphosphate (Ap4A) HIT family hydrolase